MLIRGQPQEVSQELLDVSRSQLLNCRIWGDDKSLDADTVDGGDDGVPDMGWTRNDIAAWLKDNAVRTRAGLTKAQLLGRVSEYLNPTVEEETAEEEVVTTEENNSGDGFAEDTQE